MHTLLLLWNEWADLWIILQWIRTSLPLFPSSPCSIWACFHPRCPTELWEEPSHPLQLLSTPSNTSSPPVRFLLIYWCIFRNAHLVSDWISVGWCQSRFCKPLGLLPSNKPIVCDILWQMSLFVIFNHVLICFTFMYEIVFKLTCILFKFSLTWCQHLAVCARLAIGRCSCPPRHNPYMQQMWRTSLFWKILSDFFQNFTLNLIYHLIKFP